MVKLINATSGGTSTSPTELTNVNGRLFFRADERTNGYELWKTNVAAPGVTLALGAASVTLGQSVALTATLTNTH